MLVMFGRGYNFKMLSLREFALTDFNYPQQLEQDPYCGVHLSRDYERSTMAIKPFHKSITPKILQRIKLIEPAIIRLTQNNCSYGQYSCLPPKRMTMTSP